MLPNKIAPTMIEISASADCLQYLIRHCIEQVILACCNANGNNAYVWYSTLKVSVLSSIYPLLTKHLDMPADNHHLPLLGFAFPTRG